MITEKEMVEIEKYWQGISYSSEAEQMSEHIFDLLEALRAERAALNKAALIMAEEMSDIYSYDGPCPNTHELFCKTLPWCDYNVETEQCTQNPLDCWKRVFRGEK